LSLLTKSAQEEEVMGGFEALLKKAGADLKVSRGAATGDLLRMAELKDSTTPDVVAELIKRLAAAPQGGLNGSSARQADMDLTLLDVTDVAARVGIPCAAVYKLIRRKEMGCVRVSVGSPRGKKRRIKVSPAQLRAFIASNSDAAS
jgi:hypothetical protein